MESPSSWSNLQIQQANNLCDYGGKMNLTQDIFNPVPGTSYASNPLSALMGDFGVIQDQTQTVNGSVFTTSSLDSLDFLLSASNNSNNDNTSAEDDGSFWNFPLDSAISSGETAMNMSKTKQNPSKRRNDQPKAKRPRSNNHPTSSNINFQQPNSSPSSSTLEPDQEAIAQMKEFIYRAAAFRPVNLGLELVEKPKRKNIKVSSDPQTVAARQRRERISERIRVLQKLVPGGSKMDTASMLDEAANYLKFLRSQVKALENIAQNNNSTTCLSFPFNHSFPMHSHFSFLHNPTHIQQHPYSS